MSAPSSWVPSDFSDIVARYQDDCRLLRTYLRSNWARPLNGSPGCWGFLA